MEAKKELSISNFKIVFDNQILEINYDTSFKEYELQTINSVIQEVLKKIGPKPLEKSSKDYILFCSCGRPFNPDKLLSQSKCPHYSESDYNEEKNKNEKYVLYEKEKEEKYDKYLTNNEISKLIMKATGAKKLEKINGIVPKKEKKNYKFSQNLINKIREYYTKKERGNKILSQMYDLKYDEEIYNDLLEMGVSCNKIKAALRMTHNSKEDAILLATDGRENVNWDNKDYLYYDNNEVLSQVEYLGLCEIEISKEFPLLDDREEMNEILNNIISQIKKNNSGKIYEEIDESEEEKESSNDDISEDSDSNMERISFHI